ncbi:MAG: TIGR03668 family PPOX class F420-dependent oxidoreductase [Chloroflexi bacterium]|nr:TIGR03668 family PPOX class F420-dependent oxidoreductase [Chloroflexota bacterium]
MGPLVIQIRMTAWERDFLTQHSVAHLATVDKLHHPHALPIVYAFDGTRLYTPLDAKPKRVEPSQLQRVRDIQANPQVAIVVDEYDIEWKRLAWVQVRGKAEMVGEGEFYEAGIRLLTDKYSQYRVMPLTGKPLIVVLVEKILSWKI